MKTEHSSKDDTNPSSPSANRLDDNDVAVVDRKDVAELDSGPEAESNDATPTDVSIALSLTEESDDDDDQSSLPVIEELEVLNFDDLDLEPELLQVIQGLGWTKPTPVQGKCLPHTVVGKDVAGFAQTGTGKTGVFLITLANTIKRAKDNKMKGSPKALILVPTRELAVQIDSDAQPIFDALKISSLAVYGGVDYEKQASRIKEGVDVIVATPGRLKDYYQKKILSLEYCNQFVCDEADRMFDMGFVEDIEFFLSKLTEKTQKLLFSATTNDQVKELAFEYLENPEYISVNPEVMTPERIEQHAILCESTQKLQVMLGLLQEHQPKCSIIFTNTKLVAEWLQYKLEKNGIVVDLITGDLPQRKRISLINRIKAGEIKALIATDVASRGLHISDITHVYNFDLPNEASNYVHRIGRTARAGAKGFSYSLVCEDYGHNLQAIKDYIGDQIEITTGWYKDEYLNIVDQAGNPYQDPEFKSSSMKADGGGISSGRGDGRRSSPRRDKPKSGRDGEQRARQEGGAQGRGRRGGGRYQEERSADGQRSGQRRGGQHQQGQGTDRHQQKRRRRSGKPRPEHRQPAQEAPQVARPVESPSTIGGIFKKIVSVMFGRKNK